MAKHTPYDKLVNQDSLFTVTTLPRKMIAIKKIDADSIPAAYAGKVKISVLDNSEESNNVNYAFYAAYDGGTTLDTDRVFEHAVVGPGGGTCWLNLHRKIWRTEEDNGTVGDPITIWVESSASTDSTTWYITTFSHRADTENL
jgi:hypothetical protein